MPTPPTPAEAGVRAMEYVARCGGTWWEQKDMRTNQNLSVEGQNQAALWCSFVLFFALKDCRLCDPMRSCFGAFAEENKRRKTSEQANLEVCYREVRGQVS